MKKVLILLSIIFSTVQLRAQMHNDSEANSCAAHKVAMHDRVKKKLRAAAYPNALMGRYDVKHYFLELEAERNSTVITGITTLKVLTTLATDTFCFELNKNLILDSVQYNNSNLVFSRDANSVTYAKFTSAIASGSLINVKVFYHGDAFVTGSAAIGSGFSTGTSGLWGNQATWSLSEPYSAVDWFACKQFLMDKADSATIHVITDNQNKVGSNGNLIGVEPMPNNKVKYKWHTNYIIDYYLISVAISKYVDYTIYAHPTALPNDSIKIMNYVYNNPNTLTTFKPQIDSIPLFLENYSNLFGLYPFWKEKYGNCLAPFGGGMEHQTMTSIGNLSSMSTNTHELLHHWFGDFVTCKTWADIYINEGLTSYGEVLTIEKFRPAASLVNKLNNLNNDITSLPDGSVFCTDTTSNNRIFSGRLTYNKGSMVTHTLRFVLGDSLFFKTLKTFVAQYGNSNASIMDFKQVAETISGQNLTAFFNQWIYGEGHPIWNAEYYSTGTNIVLKVTHQGSAASNNLYQTPLQLKLLSASGDTTVKVDINTNANSFLFLSKKIITGVEIDPNIKMARVIGTIKENPALITDLKIATTLDKNIQICVSQNKLQIQSNFTKTMPFKIIDMNGKCIQNLDVTTGSQFVDISDFVNGIYLLSNTDGSIQFVK